MMYDTSNAISYRSPWSMMSRMMLQIFQLYLRNEWWINIYIGMMGKMKTKTKTKYKAYTTNHFQYEWRIQGTRIVNILTQFGTIKSVDNSLWKVLRRIPAKCRDYDFQWGWKYSLRIMWSVKVRGKSTLGHNIGFK